MALNEETPGGVLLLRGLIGKGWEPLGSALISEPLPEYVVGRHGVDVIRREPGIEVLPHSDLSHTAGPPSHPDNSDAD